MEKRKIVRRDEWLPDYEMTWDRHKGNTMLAAQILGMKRETLERAIYRARAAGVQIRISGVRY